MKNPRFLAAGAAWLLLAAFALEPRVRTILRSSSRIFLSPEKRSIEESGHPKFHEALSRLRSAAVGRDSAVVLWHSPPGKSVFFLYRASYELYPLKVRFIPLEQPPPGNEEIRLLLEDPAFLGRDHGSNLYAAIGSDIENGAARIYRTALWDREGVVFRLVDPPPVPASPRGAGRPWLWPMGLLSVIALGMFFSWAAGLNSVFAGGRTAWLGFAFISGSALIGFAMMGLSLAGLRANLFSTLGLIVLLGTGWAWLRLRRGSAKEMPLGLLPTGSPVEESSWFDRAGMGLIILGLTVAILRALIPFEAWHNWDAWAIWDLKAKACFEERGIPNEYLRQDLYSFSHRDYPLGLPLLQAYLAYWSGGISNVLLRMISPCFYLVLLLMTADMLLSLGLTKGRWLLAGLLGLLPFILDQAANGYADLPLAAAMTACLAVLLRALRGRAPVWAVAWLGAAAASIKDEGLIWAGACTLVGFWGMRNRLNWRRAAAAGLLLLVLAGFWKTVSLRLGLSSTDRVFDIPIIFRESGKRVSLIIKGFVLETVGPGIGSGGFWGRPEGGMGEIKAQVLGKWLLFWQATFIALLLGIRKLSKGLRPYLAAILAIQAGAVVAAYLSSSHDMGWHLVTSLDRILLQVSPACMGLAVSCLPFTRDLTGRN